MRFVVDPTVETATCLRGGYLSHPVVPEQHRVGRRLFIRIAAQDGWLYKFLLPRHKDRSAAGYVRRPLAGFALIADLTNARNEALRKWAADNEAKMEDDAAASADSPPQVLDLGLDDDQEKGVSPVKRRRSNKPLPSAHPPTLDVVFFCRYTEHEYQLSMLWAVGRQSVFIEFTSENLKMLLASAAAWRDQADGAASAQASAAPASVSALVAESRVVASASQSEVSASERGASAPEPYQPGGLFEIPEVTSEPKSDDVTREDDFSPVWLTGTRRFFVAWHNADGKRIRKYFSALQKDGNPEKAKEAAWQRAIEWCMEQGLFLPSSD